jgi:hypothetical protein
MQIADPGRLWLTALGFVTHGRPLRRGGMGSGVNGRSGPSHGMRMLQYIRWKFANTNMALVAMRWRRRMMPDV